MKPILFSGFVGYGDSIYRRPFVRHALKMGREVYVKTAWPSAFYDMPEVRLVKLDRPKLPSAAHSRSMNHAVWKHLWTTPPPGVEEVRLIYRRQGMHKFGSILECYARHYGYEGVVMDDIAFGAPEPRWTREADLWMMRQSIIKPIALVKSPAIRFRWSARARLPDPRVYQEAVNAFRAKGFRTVAFGADAPGEWDEYAIEVDERVSWPWDHPGILQEVVRQAKVVIGFPSFLLPLTLALQHQGTLMVWGGYQKRERLTHPLLRDPLYYLEPEQVCDCFKLNHDCVRRIPGGKTNEKADAVARAASRPA